MISLSFSPKVSPCAGTTGAAERDARIASMRKIFRRSAIPMMTMAGISRSPSALVQYEPMITSGEPEQRDAPGSAHTSKNSNMRFLRTACCESDRLTAPAVDLVLNHRPLRVVKWELRPSNDDHHALTRLTCVVVEPSKSGNIVFRRGRASRQRWQVGIRERACY